MRKIKILLMIIKNIKNWPTYILDHFKLIGSKNVTYTLRNGIKCRVRSRSFDWAIINEVWNHKDYTPEGIQVKDDACVIDIGAHIGIFSVFAAYHAKNGRVFSFEPVPENYNMLLENVRLNNLNNITPLNMAVCDKEGKTQIFLSDENTGGHSIYDRSDKGNRLDIVCTTLDAVLKKYDISTIDFLKMDCEGAEYKILYNISDSIIEKVKIISMEYHNLNDELNVESLQTFFESKGFKVSVITGKTRMLYASR